MCGNVNNYFITQVQVDLVMFRCVGTAIKVQSSIKKAYLYFYN